MNKIAKLRIQSALIQQCRCFYCGLAMIEPALPQFTPKELKPKLQKYLLCTAEHLTARKDQGRDTAQNIVAACWWCNTRRHKGRKENAPNPQQYRQRVQSLMKRGRWHPVSALAVAFRANDSELASLHNRGQGHVHGVSLPHTCASQRTPRGSGPMTDSLSPSPAPFERPR